MANNSGDRYRLIEPLVLLVRKTWENVMLFVLVFSITVRNMITFVICVSNVIRFITRVRNMMSWLCSNSALLCILPKLFFTTIVQNITPGGRRSKTLFTIDKRGSKIDWNSVFDCHLSPDWRQMTIENSVSNDF